MIIGPDTKAMTSSPVCISPRRRFASSIGPRISCQAPAAPQQHERCSVGHQQNGKARHPAERGAIRHWYQHRTGAAQGASNHPGGHHETSPIISQGKKAGPAAVAPDWAWMLSVRHSAKAQNASRPAPIQISLRSRRLPLICTSLLTARMGGMCADPRNMSIVLFCCSSLRSSTGAFASILNSLSAS